MKKKFSMPLTIQYFLTYLAVMLTVMLLLLAFVYSSFYQFHSRIQLDEYQNGLERIRQAHENMLSDIMRINNQIATSTKARPFSFLEEPNRADPLIREIERIKATSPSVFAIFLHYNGEDYIYSNNSSCRMDAYFTSASAYSKTTPKEMTYLLETISQITLLESQTVEGYAFGVYDKPIQVVPVLLPFSYMNIQPCGAVIYLTKLDVYEKWFTSMASETVDVYILQDGKVIAGRNESGVPLNLLLNAQEASMEYDHQTYHILRTSGAEYSCEYLMLVSARETQVSMSGSVRVLLIISALIAAAGALLSMRIVQSRVRPIKLLHSMISDRSPSGNELMEIRDGIQRLIEENAVMSSHMEDMEPLRKSDFVRRFLVGAFKSEDEYLTFAETISLNVDTACYAVAIIAKPADAEYELTAEKINRLFEGEVCGVARTLGVQDRLVLVAFAGEKQMLTDFLESKLTGIRACCSGVTMAVSGVHSDYREGQRAYLEAENAFELRFIKGNARALMFSELSGTGSGRMQYNPQLMERLRKALHVGDAAQVSAALREITRAMQGMDASLFDFRCMYNDILNVVSSEAREQGVQEEAVYDLFKLSQCLSLDDLDAMLHHVCAGLVSDRIGRQRPQASEPVARAYEIILRRFSEPGLSVSAIAEEVGMSDSRLSTEFKRVYRMTPLEHITRARMQRARRLLLTTDMPVKDIAVECGYYDFPGFNRRFKAYTGMTPQQYKQSGDASGGMEDGDLSPDGQNRKEYS